MLIPVPFATKDDLAVRWRTLTAAEQTLATTLLADASSLILDECSRANVVPDDDAAALESRTATLKRIACAVVKRAMMNGADSPALESLQESAGPWSATQKFANPTGDLYLKKSEIAALPCSQQAAFSIPMSPALLDS